MLQRNTAESASQSFKRRFFGGPSWLLVDNHLYRRPSEKHTHPPTPWSCTSPSNEGSKLNGGIRRLPPNVVGVSQEKRQYFGKSNESGHEHEMEYIGEQISIGFLACPGAVAEVSSQ
jgi:hypothetical protein